MKTAFLAAAVALSLGAAPALAGEGNGDPFPFNAGSQAASAYAAQPQFADTGSNAYPDVVGRPGADLAPAGTRSQFADTGSNAYPDVAGRPGADLPSLAGAVLPTNGSQGIVQTANSLPSHFEDGTVAYAQATRVRNWVTAHAQRPAAVASAASRTPGG